METKQIANITIEYDEREARVMAGDYILAKIYVCKDGLMVTVPENKSKDKILEGDCPHQGTWKSIGIVNVKEGLDSVASSTYCEECGKIKIVKD